VLSGVGRFLKVEIFRNTSAKTDPAFDPSALRPDTSDVFSAFLVFCAS